MNDTPQLDQQELIRRISRDLADGYDEELEMEIEDRPRIPGLPAETDAEAEKAYRLRYFNDLFRLQAELVKLQDWVVYAREKVVIVFEGRDAAGKGGIIKRITQRLNPRVCRAVALPAPNDRERAPSGISSATYRICRRPVRSFYSTAVGITAPASSG
jgi:polyphosphate kinase